MLKEFSVRLDSLPRPIKFIRVLEEFDVDILTIYQSINGGAFYLEKLCTRFESTMRYLIVRTEPRSIAEYLGKKMPLLELLNYSSDGGGFIIDRTPNQKDIIYSVRLSDLPSKYLPKETAYHDESLRPDWSVIPQDFLIDRKDWDAKLLALIEKRYLDVFGFSYFTEKGKNRKLPDSIFSYVYEGGFTIMHVFNSIRGLIPSFERAKSVGVFAASPGLLTIDAPAATVKNLTKSFESLANGSNEYQRLHDWSKLSVSHYDKIPEDSLQDIENLALILGIETSALFPRPSENIEDPMKDQKYILTAGKLIAAYYRKLWKLLEPEEGVEFISVNMNNLSHPPVNVYDEDYDE